MNAKKKIFLYPISDHSYEKGSNTYIKKLKEHLNANFDVINGPTRLGLVDILRKAHRCDIVYFNWPEDILNRRFGYVQYIMLHLLIFYAKALKVKIIWFIHNNISHTKTHLRQKMAIVTLMKRHAALILAHSNEVKIDLKKTNFHVFDHPIDDYKPVELSGHFEYDLLIWGSVAPYKGVLEFVKAAHDLPAFKRHKIMIAGKVASDSYFDELQKYKSDNIQFIRKILSEEELAHLFQSSRYVLFTYISPSVLSSGALSKTLSYGKEIIAPSIGSFKELGCKGLLYHYTNFESLGQILAELKTGSLKPIDKVALATYIQSHTWEAFTSFVSQKINALYAK